MTANTARCPIKPQRKHFMNKLKQCHVKQMTTQRETERAYDMPIKEKPRPSPIPGGRVCFPEGPNPSGHVTHRLGKTQYTWAHYHDAPIPILAPSYNNG